MKKGAKKILALTLRKFNKEIEGTIEPTSVNDFFDF